jgi:hypothetical protein
LEVAPGMVIHERDWQIDEVRILASATEFGNPLFVKPARSGSSRGTSKVKNVKELKTAINFALQFDTKVLVESTVVGREIECAVLQLNGVAVASPVGEIKILGDHEFYDIDLTIGDRGRFGGQNSWNNYFPVSNPNNSKAFIYNLNIPADLFPGQNVDIKAKAYHRN